MLSIKIFPVLRRDQPLMWDVYSYIDGEFRIVETLPTAKAQKRLDQARADRARAEMVPA